MSEVFEGNETAFGLIVFNITYVVDNNSKFCYSVTSGSGWWFNGENSVYQPDLSDNYRFWFKLTPKSNNDTYFATK